MSASAMATLQQQIVACTQCPRLTQWCQQVATEKRKQFADWDYWGKPVPSWGDAQAELLIIGLAPAAHGANRTGRMFTGDRSGDWLYRALHKAGFANQPTCTDSNDGLRLNNCWITAAAHCAPPQNKPTPEELAHCRPHLEAELALLPNLKVILCLGNVALGALWQGLKASPALQQRLLNGNPLPEKPIFTHGGLHPLSNTITLALSYHPSQQNTFTGKLTEPMLDGVFSSIQQTLAG